MRQREVYGRAGVLIAGVMVLGLGPLPGCGLPDDGTRQPASGAEPLSPGGQALAAAGRAAAGSPRGDSPRVDPAPASPGGPAPIVNPDPVADDELLGIVQVNTWRGTCSGVVIASDVVLTAAHCVCTESTVGGNVCDPTVSVRFRRDPDTGVSTTIAGKATWHPSYNPSWTDNQYENDLAVVKIERPGPAHARPFALAEANLPSGSQVLIAGFGHTGGSCGGASGTLNSDVVTIDSYEDSSKIMTFFDPVFCSGDSGGAILDLAGRTVHGIHSMSTWSPLHGSVNKSAATPPYRTWISSFLPPPVANDVCRTAPPRRPLGRPVLDTVLRPTLPSDLVAPWNSGGTAAAAHFSSNGAAFLPHTQWLTQGGWDDAMKWAAGDFNGDGRIDLATVFEEGGRNSIGVRLSTGGSFTLGGWSSRQGWFRENSQLLPGDFDGDGKDDLALVVEEDGAASIGVFRSTGTSFEALRWWMVKSGGWDDSIKWTVGDFNGDRKADIAAVWNDGGMNTLTVRASTGSGFTQVHWAVRQGGWMDSTRWLPGDFNGDGLTDLAAAWNNGAQTSVAVFTSSGSAFPSWGQWLTQGGWIDSARWAAGDFNNDGKADLAAIWNSGGSNTITVRQSTGAAFIVNHWATGAGGWMDSNQWCAGRFRKPEPVLAQ
jgi:V8-like Glu-specific endopeptidase